VGNADFRVLDVRDWDEPGGYDAVYSRFLIAHLSDPASLLRRMWTAVADGGVLIVEEVDFDGWWCDPAGEAFERFIDVYRQAAARRGADDVFGRKLFRHFLAAGIPAPRVRVVQPVFEGEARMLPASTLESAADAILADGLATGDEIAGMLTALRRLADDDSTLLCGPRIFQVWSRR
jgi:hypothetical protein